MIGSLRGTVLERRSNGELLLEVAGVGYLLNVTPRTLAELEPGSTAFLYVHHHIREESQTLFGFLTSPEQATFQTLISTHGIGPSLGLAVLATHTPSALIDIVASNDLAALTMVSGVGKKTAERLLIELKNRLNLPILDVLDASSTSSTPPSVVSSVREALLGLGYGPDEVRDALRELPASSDLADASTMLRDSLKLLGARRA